MNTIIKPTPGRIVWYRGADGFIRAAIVAAVRRKRATARGRSLKGCSAKR